MPAALLRRREKTNIRRRNTSTPYQSPGGIYQPPYGKQHVYLSGHGETGYSPAPPSVAYYNPTVPGNIAGYNPSTPGTVQYNPPTPGTATGTYNPPTPGNVAGYNPPSPGNSNPGTVLWTGANGGYTTYSDGHTYFDPVTYFTGSNPTLPAYEEFTQYFYQGSGVYGYHKSTGNFVANSYTPGNTNPSTGGTAYYNPATPGTAKYNPPTPGNAIYNSPIPGTFAGYNPPTGHTVAGYNAGSGGNVAGYNPVTPGNQSYNPPVPGQVIYGVTNGPSGYHNEDTYVSGYFAISPGTSYNPTNQWYYVYNVARPSGYYLPGNSYYNPSSGGSAYYNPYTPGNAYYNPTIPGTAYNNPTVPGTANYNPSIVGTANYNADVPGNAVYNNYVAGRPGAGFSLLGVDFPGGSMGQAAPVITRQLVNVPYTNEGYPVILPPGAALVIDEE
jgi:hypothetical protein